MFAFVCLHYPCFCFQYVIRDKQLLIKSSLVITVVVVLFFVQSFVTGLYLDIGMFSTICNFFVFTGNKQPHRRHEISAKFMIRKLYTFDSIPCTRRAPIDTILLLTGFALDK